MSLRHDYPGWIMPEEIPLIERFEQDVVPFVTKHGPEIGELAMQGDFDCEEVIRRYQLFIEGLPHLRQQNYGLLTAALKRWESKRSQ